MNDFKGVHHSYLGLFLSLIGFWCIWVSLWIAIPLMGIGQWLFYDDVYQHIRKQKEPDYHSPVHRLFGLIYKWSWVRKVTKFFDWLFGKRD